MWSRRRSSLDPTHHDCYKERIAGKMFAPMNWREGQRRIAAARKRPESSAILRLKEILALMRMNPDAAPELEVEAHERVIEDLVSLHKDAGTPIAWEDFLKVVDPYPQFVDETFEVGVEITPAKMRSLALRVLLGDLTGYIEALKVFSPLSSIQRLGTTVEVQIEHRGLAICQLSVNDRGVIPKDVKTLTATGKVSTRTMAKGRYHELYQDHVCSCVLRVGREMLALLPLETVIVTALVNTLDSTAGNEALIPVLSVAITRSKLRELDFERLDPSESMSNFLHRGDVLVSRRTGEFKAIEPLGNSEVTTHLSGRKPLRDLLHCVRQMRREVQELSAQMPPQM